MHDSAETVCKAEGVYKPLGYFLIGGPLIVTAKILGIHLNTPRKSKDHIIHRYDSPNTFHIIAKNVFECSII